ncbi:MAG TPA: hypothetical protein VJY83_00505 [Thiopseudomonas sp.]|nr:hypothetical protein [Thiopseudomonas sp.]
MSIQRRSVLKGMALSGAALALSQAGLAHAAHATPASARKPVLVLVSAVDAQTDFVSGVRANPGAAQVTLLQADHGFDFITAFQQRLSSSKGERIIGLVDDASGMLLLDLARSAGARVHWTGQHVTQNGVSRHSVSATENSANCITQFAEFAQSCSRPTAMTEQTLSASRHWASSLGFALASPEPNRRYLRTTPPTHTHAVDGHFVSFSIET